MVMDRDQRAKKVSQGLLDDANVEVHGRTTRKLEDMRVVREVKKESLSTVD
jgi:hypothetical protein